MFLFERGMEAAGHKLKVMCMDPHDMNYQPVIHYDGKIIEVVEVHTFLGVLFDKKMSFEEHGCFISGQQNQDNESSS